MATLAQTIDWAKQAGFSGLPLVVIVSIAQAESGLATHGPDGINTDGSRDRGILQINSAAHAEIPDACAYDGACAFRAAFGISARGVNFHPWSTFNNQKYLHYEAGTASAAGVPIPAAPPGLPDIAGAAGAAVNSGVAAALSAVVQPVVNQAHVWAVRIGLFLGALLLVIVGFYALGSGPPQESGTVSPALERGAGRLKP